MDNKVFGYFIFGGLLIGALFGSMWSAGGNPLLGIALGALAGASIGWFAGAAFFEQRKKQK